VEAVFVVRVPRAFPLDVPAARRPGALTPRREAHALGEDNGIEIVTES
jgi:hypothetical protein